MCFGFIVLQFLFCLDFVSSESARREIQVLSGGQCKAKRAEIDSEPGDIKTTSAWFFNVISRMLGFLLTSSPGWVKWVKLEEFHSKGFDEKDWPYLQSVAKFEALDLFSSSTSLLLSEKKAACIYRCRFLRRQTLVTALKGCCSSGCKAS